MIQKRVEAARQRQRERNNSRTRQSSVEEQSEVLPVGPIALPIQYNADMHPAGAISTTEQMENGI
jgi:hypothetical protein